VSSAACQTPSSSPYFLPGPTGKPSTRCQLLQGGRPTPVASDVTKPPPPGPVAAHAATLPPNIGAAEGLVGRRLRDAASLRTGAAGALIGWAAR